MMLRPYLWLLLSVLLTCVAAPSYGASGEFLEGRAELSATARDGASIRVVVQKMTIPLDYPIKGGFYWGGDEDEMPKALVVSVQAWVGNDKIFIPVSAYSDLGDPRSVSLKLIKTGFVLKISGGDAAGSYNATLSIEKGNIRRRKVVSGEFPDNVWEETIYSFIPRNSKM